MPDREAPYRLLILGGTGEAVALAAAVLARFAPRLAVTTALAGRTAHPVLPSGELRRGGFGGADGLAAYLTEASIDALIDATHPFATQISAHAVEACERAEVPRLVLYRPPWRRHEDDRWIEVEDAAAAAALLPHLGRRAWLTIGTRELAAFVGLRDVHFLVRLVDPPREPLPLASCEVIAARGPFEVAAETALLDRHDIDVLVTKASGGRATAAKLVAARERRLPVIMLRRPPPPPGDRVESVAGALTWLAETLVPGG